MFKLLNCRLILFISAAKYRLRSSKKKSFKTNDILVMLHVTWMILSFTITFLSLSILNELDIMYQLIITSTRWEKKKCWIELSNFIKTFWRISIAYIHTLVTACDFFSNIILILLTIYNAPLSFKKYDCKLTLHTMLHSLLFFFVISHSFAFNGFFFFFLFY